MSSSLLCCTPLFLSYFIHLVLPEDVIEACKGFSALRILNTTNNKNDTLLSSAITTPAVVGKPTGMAGGLGMSSDKHDSMRCDPPTGFLNSSLDGIHDDTCFQGQI